jgi:hypothetical protein
MIHKIEDSLVGLVPYVAIVLDGDFTKKIKENDTIETRLVKYRVDSLGFDKKLNMTTMVVREIVLEQKET